MNTHSPQTSLASRPQETGEETFRILASSLVSAIVMMAAVLCLA